MMEPLSRLKTLLGKSSRLVVLTGAGISTESGIPDYRSPGGLWEKYSPVYFQEFLRDENARELYWLQKKELYEQFHAVKPNPGHIALAHLEKTGKLLGLITQNIDGLHQEAGNSAAKVLEIHGNSRITICLSCRSEDPWEKTHERLLKGEKAPRCLSCGGLQKPATVSFGEPLNTDTLNWAREWSESCDLMLVVGTSLVVEPAAGLPRIALLSGAALAILNLGETPLDAEADVVVRGPAGTVLPGLISA
jgi:NAD-dependent deacetylase